MALRSFLYLEEELDNWESMVLEELNKSSLNNKFYLYREELLRSGQKIEFTTKYNGRPDIVSWEFYDTERTWPILTIVNKCGSLLNFNSKFLGQYFIVPNKDLIEKILTEY